jgi:hypothetical protein
VTPPTSDAFSFALSPDGRQLVFVANGEKGSQLWVRRLDQITAQPLTGTDGASFPFWAPDSHAIGFFADAKLKRIDLAGGAPQVLADVAQGRGGTWNSDGVIVFGQATPGALMRVMATGGTPVPVTRVAPGQSSHRFPQFLPDGYRILFSMAAGRQETLGVYMVLSTVASPRACCRQNSSGMRRLAISAGASGCSRPRLIPSATGRRTDSAGAVGRDRRRIFHSAFSMSATECSHIGRRSDRRRLSGRSGGSACRHRSQTKTRWARTYGRRVTMMHAVREMPTWLINVSRASPGFTFDATIDRTQSGRPMRPGCIRSAATWPRSVRSQRPASMAAAACRAQSKAARLVRDGRVLLCA